MGIWVGRYAMVQGQVREHGSWLVDQRRERDDGPVRLLVLAEPVDDRSAEFCGEVAEAVAALFGRETLSVTGGLLRALRQAHANLAEWNERSLREHQVAVGLTCVAIRDGEATVAQVGDGPIYVVDQHNTRRVSTEGLPAAAPLGGPAPIEPRFTTVHLRNEHLLMLSSVADGHVGADGVIEALAEGPERALADLFTRTREVPDMSAVLVAELDTEEDTPPLGEPEQLPEPEPTAPPPLDSGPLEVEAAPAARSAGAGAPAAGGAPEAWPHRERPPAMPAVRRPNRLAGTRQRSFATPRRPLPPWSRYAIAGAAFVALVLVAWFVVPGILDRNNASRLDDALTAAQLQVNIAEQAPSPAVQRQALVAALGQLETARSIDAEDPRLLELASEVDAHLELLNAIVDVDAMQPVLTFAGSVTAPVDPDSIVFGGGFLWLLDAAQGRVLRVDPEVSFDPIEVYAASTLYAGLVAGEPLEAAWDQSGSRLLVLDADRQLWAIAPLAEAQPAPLPLRGVDEIRSIAGIASYVGNLYILDPAAGEVWRYLPAGDGFDSERAGLLGALELPEAVQLAVDGDIYIQDGGTLRRFREGVEQDSMLVGIDQPPASPSALVEDVIRGLLYVADRGNGRIVVSDGNGIFIRQYHSPGLADLRGLALSGDGETLYVLTGDGIDAFSVAADLAAGAADDQAAS